MIGRIAAILTVIELIVLVVWLALATGAGQGVLNLARNPALAVVVLAGGLMVEEVVRFRLIKGRFPQNAGMLQRNEIMLLVIGVIVELVGWILPVARAFNALATFFILFGFLSVEHAIIDFATTGKFRIGEVLGFSATEAAGGTVWLINPSLETVGVLVVTSFIEHRQGVALSASKP